MKTWMSQKKKRHLAMLIAGTLSLTATLAVCPPSVDMRIAGVEITSSIAYAADMTSDVSTWTNGSQTFSSGQTITLTKDGTALTTFTTTKDNTTFTYETKADGSNKFSATSGGIKDLTIHANTEVSFPWFGNIMTIPAATLDGSGAAYSTTYPSGNNPSYEVIAATAEGNTGTLTYKWAMTGDTYTCTDGTKISVIENVGAETPVKIVGPSGGVVDLCGVADDGAQRTLVIQGGTTVDTGQAKITINGNSTIKVQNDATTIGSGNYGDIKKSEFGTGTLTFANDTYLTVNDLEADTLAVHSITANNLNLNTLRETGGAVNVKDTLTVGNAYLSGGSLTAGTIKASGDISNPQLSDRITVTTGDLTAGNISGIGIAVEKGNVNASGNILVNESVDVKVGNLKAGNVAAQKGNITVGGNLVAHDVDAQKLDEDTWTGGGNITAGSINATGDVKARDGDVNVTNNLTANNVSSNNITAASINAAGNVTANDTVNVTGNLTAINVSGNTIDAGSITSTGTVHGNESVTVDENLTANEVTSKVITAGSINAAGKVSADESVTAKDNLTANEVTAKDITAGSITNSGTIKATDTVKVTNDLEAENVTGKTIEAGSITSTGKVSADESVNVTDNLTAKDVSGKTITAGSINATGNVAADDTVNVTGNLTAINVTGNTIKAGSITSTGKVSADESVTTKDNLTANEVTAKDITAGSITNSSTIKATDTVKVTNDPEAENVTGKTIEAGSITSTGKVSADESVNVTGNLKADTVDAGTTLTAGSITATGSVSAGESITANKNIEANDITANTVSADEITAANKIEADEVTGRVITADSIKADTVSAGESVTANKKIEANDITAHTVSADEIAAANKIDADEVSGRVITADSIKADTVSASESVTANKNIEANDITADTVSAGGDLTANNIKATGAVTAGGNLTANDVTANTVFAAGNVKAKSLTADSVEGETIEVDSLKANKITVGELVTQDDVTANTFSTRRDLTANNITVDTVSAGGNLTANDITAKDAVSAGKNITANDIKADTVSAGENISANNITANEVSGKVITAASINAGTVSADESVHVKDTLSVTKSLNAPEITAGTFILPEGATAHGNIATDALWVDSKAVVNNKDTDIKVKANTASKVNIEDADGVKIKNQATVAAIAAAVGLGTDSYISRMTEARVPVAIRKIATVDPFTDQLWDDADLEEAGLPGERLAAEKAKLAQAYRTSQPVRGLVNATANTGAAATQAITNIFTSGVTTRTAELRAGTPASADMDKDDKDVKVSSIWVSTKGGKTKMDGGDYADTDVRVRGYQAGYDVKLSNADYLGFYLGTANGYTRTDGSYGKRVDIKNALSYGIYGTHAFGGGRYLDYIVHGGKFENRIDGFDRWDTKSYGGVLTYGRQIRTSDKLTLDPYLRFKYDHIKIDDKTIAGNKITTDDENALSLKLGLNAFTNTGLYGGVAYSRGLSGDLTSYVNTIAMPSSDFDDNVYYLNIGYKGNLSKNVLFNVNYERMFGDYRGWTAEARLDFRF